MLLPPHEDIVGEVEGGVVEVVRVERLGVLVERNELALEKEWLIWFM